MYKNKMPRKQSRCKKGSRRCFSSRKCVAKNNTKRTRKCPKGERQCADRVCYRKGYSLRRRT